MKKIIHKLKKNRLVSKIAALFTICMILVSCFTVSSFAADEEDATNSITDVWTGVTDSIISLLGTAQGVFVSDGLIRFVPNLGDVDGNPYLFYVTNMPDPPPDSFYVTDGSDTFRLDLVDFVPSQSNLFASRGYVLTGLSSDPVVFYSEGEDGTVSGWFITASAANVLDVDFFYSSGTFSLTFLGILAVIGVALSIILLLIFVISRFIHLRG